MSTTLTKLEAGEYHTKIDFGNVDAIPQKPTEPKTSKELEEYSAKMKEYLSKKEAKEALRKKIQKDIDRLDELFWDDLLEEYFPTVSGDRAYKIRSFIYNKMDSKAHAISLAEELSEIFSSDLS